MKLSFFASKYHSDPEAGELDFADLPGFLRDNAEADKETAALWSPSDMQGGKTVGHTKSVEALALDFDHVEPPWARLSGWSYFAHTTHSHTPEDPHWRVVVELEEPGDPATWKTQFKVKMQQHGFEMDPSCCNPNRQFFVPPPGAHWVENEGRPAKMPPAGAALQQETGDRAENHDGLLSDGALFWPDVERMMRSLPPSISGQGGDDRLFEAACVLRSSFRLTPEAAMRALRDHFNPRCKPPWDEERLAHKVREAVHDTQNVPGELVPPGARAALRAKAGYVEPPPDPPAPAVVEPAPWRPATSWVALVTKVDYLSKDLGIRDGRPSLWTADARCGKSTLAASVAFAAAAGRKLWGHLDVGPGCDVLYVAGEDLEGVARVWKRLERDQKCGVPSRLNMSQRLPLAGPAFDATVWTRAMKEHKLVIVDTLRSMSSGSGVDENDAAFADGLYALEACAQGTGCCVIVLHHNNKQGKSNGTAALFGAAGNHLEMTREAGQDLHCYAAGTRDGLKIRSFTVKYTGGTAPAPEEDPDSDGLRLEYEMLAEDAQKVAADVGRAVKVMFERLREADRWLTKLEMSHDISAGVLKEALPLLQGQIGFQASGGKPMYHWNKAMEPKS
jgi:hypothetical protein